MALLIPKLDERNYQDLVNEALARVPVHTPEWTSFGEADPGVTLVELFAFLSESISYRANLIPERNRLKFLSLLGLPLQPATAARALVTLLNERGPLAVLPLARGTELRAGEVPFSTDLGLDVLPLEAQAFAKLEVADPPAAERAYYENLYRAALDEQGERFVGPRFYRTVQLDANLEAGIELSATVGHSLWIALLARTPEQREETRRLVAGRVLSLGWVPGVDEGGRSVGAGTPGGPSAAHLLFELPWIDDGQTGVPVIDGERTPKYRALTATYANNVLVEPGVLELQLPALVRFGFWDDIEPLEPGVGDFPPTLEDTTLEQRLVTWLRVRTVNSAAARVTSVGINAARTTQRTRVLGEVLPDGTGEPDQSTRLAQRPVVPGSARLRVLNLGASSYDDWTEIDDLSAAGPEVPKRDPRQPPGVVRSAPRASKVFAIDAQAGELKFGDGLRGARPMTGAKLAIDYDVSLGSLGNVGQDAFNPLPNGLQVNNPVPAWGGSDAESAEQGERQIARYLQHRDRLVTTADFEALAWRTPGVTLGRVDVLPSFRPVPGGEPILDAPGVVTLLVVPRSDPRQPEAPRADRALLDAVCVWLEPRRLVTTELILRGPEYVDVSLSVGVEVVPGATPRDVLSAVQEALRQFLSPLPRAGARALASETALLVPPQAGVLPAERGWPLAKPVIALELQAVASRVPGVAFVKQVLLGARGTTDATDALVLRGLELPRLVAISVNEGDAVPLGELQRASDGDPEFLPIPIVPEVCG